jgi:hypothetical protein
MPRYDVFQTMSVNGVEFSRSKVRISGDKATDAAVNWVKTHGMPKADRKQVRILGNSTKFIEAEYDFPAGNTVRVELIPVDGKNQCKDCGYPKEATNPTCYGQCEEWRNEEVLPMDIEDATDMIQELM